MLTSERISIPPIAVSADGDARDTGDLLLVIVKATDQQVETKGIQDAAARGDFAISGDALTPPPPNLAMQGRTG